MGASRDPRSQAAAALTAMLICDFPAAAFLAHAGLVLDCSGILRWPAFFAHMALAPWWVGELSQERG